jgi:hypothetical protein
MRLIFVHLCLILSHRIENRGARLRGKQPPLQIIGCDLQIAGGINSKMFDKIVLY